MYKVEMCRKKPLIGYLINRLAMPPINGRAWDAFLVRATEPTLGVDRDGNVQELGVGSEVLIPATYELAQFFSRAASSPTNVFEVFIGADKKIPIGGGQTMWTFELWANPEPVARAKFGLAAALGEGQRTPAPAALPSGDAAEPASAGDDIPF